ncbi:bifunctional DNA-binding transcriptional regulator/O6-methylguanine-DNA methyltransferase Ada [Marinobacter adhaerens]|uniref:methylated-DNA--[protein]-cysteine S-methyltransferase n=1 Tax=Marinobacter adhaerens TaxID=1033846 RepID=A0A851HLT0_9GAMM|nr:bifunctional DNA-binding transcriptional regulator/O6-methylguanine-DNA methyltransferase Ada [Marinobacter adhaerens]NWN89943.1 bifunctional DNA-binding transcriptional regulator/O6-methylguanine-DNA methyltransferase Ada [Marinobacter adhaerens]
MTMPTEQEMKAAVAARDPSRDGDFCYGVITTGVCCKPSCRARTAKPENLRFFPDIEAALAAGFRPCKRCLAGDTRSRVAALTAIARYIDLNAEERLTLATLAEIAGLSPSRLQRTFKEAFGVSPKAYQDAARMRRFKQSLKAGEGVTDAIFASGFGSISRVYGEASRDVGMPPKAYRAGGAGEVITFACRTTALGVLAMAATDKGVCFAQFGDNEASLLAELTAEFPNAELRASPAHDASELDAWITALDQYLSEGAPRPELPVDMRGTAFQIKVWTFLTSTQEGDILSYSELAQQIDKPKAVRAVASACGRNRIGVLIPCHRVLRGDGGLGGYRWGLERKQALIELEREHDCR